MSTETKTLPNNEEVVELAKERYPELEEKLKPLIRGLHFEVMMWEHLKNNSPEDFVHINHRASVIRTHLLVLGKIMGLPKDFIQFNYDYQQSPKP